MTQDSGYSPLTPSASTGSSGGAGQPQPTAQVARDQAGEVAHTTQQAGQQVAQTAAEQAREVAAEARRQARDLLGEARSQAADQASQQQKRAVEALRELARELGQMAERGGQSGVATEFAHTASERLHGVANWVDQREPGTLVEEVRAFARRRPGAFLVGAALAGVAAGRLTRGIAEQRGGERGPQGRSGVRDNRLDYGGGSYGATGSYGAAGDYGSTGAASSYGSSGNYGAAGNERSYAAPEPGYAAPEPGYAAPGADGTYPTTSGYGASGSYDRGTGTEATYGSAATGTGTTTYGQGTESGYGEAGEERTHPHGSYDPRGTTDPRRPGTDAP